jgi:5-formyltetrahydrofolate cyclo-ligase
LSADKRETRKLIQESYSGIGDDLKKELDHKLSSLLVTLFTQLSQNQSFHNQKVLGVYSPLRDEPDWTVALADQDLSLAFPYWLSDGEMEFKQAKGHELATDESFGVKMGEPQKDHPTVVPEVFLVPGVAFTETGVRLGRGKGYYDRYLENHSGLKIGLCFEFQILSELAREDHDVLMDYLVTEKRVICCKSLE